MDPIERKLLALGHAFRDRTPARKIESCKVVGEMAYLSGHGPHEADGSLKYVGKVGKDLTVEQGYAAAARVAVNCLGSLRNTLGSLEDIEEVVKVLGYVHCTPEFDRQPDVMNGFTDLLLEVLGDKGRHARSAIGASSLPHGQAVEVEMIVRIRRNLSARP